MGLEIHQCHLLGEITHQYPDKSVQLIIFQVTQFSGNASCLEGQLNMKWIEKDKLNPEDFPEANKNIFDLIPIVETTA